MENVNEISNNDKSVEALFKYKSIVLVKKKENLEKKYNEIFKFYEVRKYRIVCVYEKRNINQFNIDMMNSIISI